MLDLLIIHGHVIDPANHIDEVRPVAVYNGEIVPYDPRGRSTPLTLRGGTFFPA